jgi:hypothetical protein
MLAAHLVLAGIYLRSRKLPSKATYAKVFEECTKWFRDELRRRPCTDTAECLELMKTCVHLHVAHCVDVISTDLPEPRECFCSPNELLYVIKTCALVFPHSDAKTDPVLVVRNKQDRFSLYYVMKDTCHVIARKDAGLIWATLCRVFHSNIPSKRKSLQPQNLYAIILQKNA